MEVGGGLSVLVGYKTKLGAWALFLFLIPTTLIFHHNVGDKMQMIMFLKNLAIMGGLLQLALHGAGGCSLDNRNCSLKDQSSVLKKKKDNL
jgi:putative oxidoreductase